MSDIRFSVKKKNNNFTIIDNSIFKDKDLSFKAKGLLCTLLSLPDTWDLSIEGLTKLSTDGTTSVQTALTELHEAGYLSRRRIHRNGRLAGWLYTVFEEKQTEFDESIIIEQYTENQHIENQHIENPVQLSTKQLSTNSINNTKVEQSSLLQAKPKTPKRESLYVKCCNLIDEYTDNSKVKDLLMQYLKIRLSIKDKPMGANQWKAILNKLAALKAGGNNEEEVIRQSMEKGYASFFEVTKRGYSKNVKDQPWEKNVHTVSQTQEDIEEQEQFIEKLKSEGKQWQF